MKTFTLLLLTILCLDKITSHRAIPNKVIETTSTPSKIPTLTTEKINTTNTNTTITTNSQNCTDDAARSSYEPLFIDSYLAPSMQALAYYIELLQYEPGSMTTIEPPFDGWEAEGGTTYKPPPTPPRPSTTTTTKSSTVWWKPPSTQSTIWWVPPSTTKRTTTSRPSTTTQTTTKYTTTKKPYTSTQLNDETESTTQWWQTSTKKTTKKPTSTVPSTTWWVPPSWWTTSKPPSTTTTTTSSKRTTTTYRPITTTKTTYRPITTTNPPETTPIHRPGVFAPTAIPIIPLSPAQASAPVAFASNYRPQFTSLNNKQNNYKKITEKFTRVTNRFPKAIFVDGRNTAIVTDNNKVMSASSSSSSPSSLQSASSTSLESGSMLSNSFDKDFFSWFTQKQAKLYKADYEYDFQLLDPLPGALIRDIIQEKSELPAITDSDNINEFLKIYDDNFGKSSSLTGKKRIPITKPYVEFLMLYDMLKRDAKAMNLSRYEGYSEEMLHELAELSQRSAERQLHALLTRMLLRNDVDRTDTISRVKGIIKDLETSTSITAKAMRYFPPLQFVP